MDPEFDNEQGGDAGGWDGNDEGGANNDGEHVLVMKMILMIWRKWFGSLDQRFY